MRKFTLLVLGLFMALGASADNKVIYQQNFQDKNKALEAWANSRSAVEMSVVQTQELNYLQLTLGQNNGTRYNSFWGDVYGNELAAGKDYTLSFMFNYAQFGNQSSNAAQRNNEIAIWNIPATGLGLGSYWGSTAELINANATAEAPVEGAAYLFKLTQCASGSAAGDGGYATSATGTCYFNVNIDSDVNSITAPDSINLSASQWYVVNLTVSGQKVDYTITPYGEEAPLRSGSRTLPEGVDNRAGGLITYQARYQGILDFADIKISHEVEGEVAANPTVILSEVRGNDRVYNINFSDGEELHYTLPGGEEQVIDYWSAYNEVTNVSGSIQVVVTQSGDLVAYTTKGEAKSDVITTPVECGRIQLPAPTYSITSVEEGFGKTFNVSVDNASVLLSPAVALSWTIKYNDGTSETGSYTGSSTSISLPKAGTATIKVTSIPVEGVYYYDANEVVLTNDVEYTIAKDVQYHEWTEAQLSANPAFEKSTEGVVADTNTSHWGGRWMNEHPKGYTDGTDGVADWWKAPSKVFTTIEDVNAYIWFYTLTNDEDGENYAKELLPLIPSTSRANIGIFSEEGIVVNTTSYKECEITFDPAYVTDDATKPNFIEISKVGSYDRYDKQPGCHSVDIVKTDVTTYTLYRFDTAIKSARVFVYKGFVPQATEVAAPKAVVEDANAPIYTIGGVKVSTTEAGKIYIQNGKKFLAK